MFARTSPQFEKLLEKATSNLMLEPDWPTIISISDLIRQGDCPPKYALKSLKKKLQSTNPHTSAYALLVLESMVKNCGHLVHDEIATPEFMEDMRELVKKASTEKVRQKALELLQTWACAFRSNPKYQIVQDTVKAMKAEGYKFPTLTESDAMFVADTAPKWVNAVVCHRCRTSFSLFVRKHHCRACGNIFCSQCTPKTAPLPKFGIEKDVRVCEACYELLKKPQSSSPHVKHDETLPAEYISSSLAQQTQVPKPKKTDEELKEEEDMQLALALSQSEAEAREKEKKRATSEIMSNTNRVEKSVTPAILNNDEEEEDPELAKYLNRSYWEEKHSEEKSAMSEKKVLSPEHFRVSPAGPPSAPITPTHQLENGEVSETELNEFVSFLKSQVEIFVNRMKSNSSRGRSISNDSSVQTLFMNVTKNHSTLLTYIHQQDDSRVYFEGLQDKLAQVKDAMMALDALREEHREKLRREAEEAERIRQLQMAQKLEIMRRRKQEFLQFQRQLAIQKVQEQEREMQLRQEQQKQQYLKGSTNIPQHVSWDANARPLLGPAAQYGQQYQSLPGGFIQSSTYSMPGPPANVTQPPNSIPMQGGVPPGTQPQVLPHPGQIPVNQDQARGPPPALPQQPRLMAPQPNPVPGGPVSGPLGQIQLPPANFQGVPVPTGNHMLPQTRSLVMPPPGGPGPSSVPPNMTMGAVPPQVVGMKPRLLQNVGGLPPHVVVLHNPNPPIPLPHGSQQRLPQGHPQSMVMPPPNMGMMHANNGPVNGHPNMVMPAPLQHAQSDSQIHSQTPQQAMPPGEQNESKTGELISFD